MSNRPIEHHMETYASMIAKRLRELREERMWSIEDFRQKLAEHGIVGKDGLLPKSTVYSYEIGSANSGATIPVNYFPVIAKIYGFRNPREWLPEEWPSDGGLLGNTFPCP